MRGEAEMAIQIKKIVPVDNEKLEGGRCTSESDGESCVSVRRRKLCFSEKEKAVFQ